MKDGFPVFILAGGDGKKKRKQKIEYLTWGRGNRTGGRQEFSGGTQPSLTDKGPRDCQEPAGRSAALCCFQN